MLQRFVSIYTPLMIEPKISSQKKRKKKLVETLLIALYA